MKNPGLPWPDNEVKPTRSALNPRAAWPFPCKVVLPHNIINHNGEKWIEVEWPTDGRYGIGYQLAKEQNGAMRLFESTNRRLKSMTPPDAKEPR